MVAKGVADCSGSITQKCLRNSFFVDKAVKIIITMITSWNFPIKMTPAFYYGQIELPSIHYIMLQQMNTSHHVSMIFRRKVAAHPH